jgi:UDP-GlcNAc3NAcA epimerase
VICRALARPANSHIQHVIIHTGQHYDPLLSSVFFEELGIPAPDLHLDVGSGSHGAQTGEMIKRLEPGLLEMQPDWILLYGDTNSTLAAALVAAKLGYRMAHVEAGLRSYNRGMPEEINRVVVDHLSHALFCPTRAAMANLRKEGLHKLAVRTGDVMYDAALTFGRMTASLYASPLESWSSKGEFALATIHRAENTDDPHRLRSILRALNTIATQICPVVLPLHPRTRKILHREDWSSGRINIIEPVPYLQMLSLESQARFILTDSGGVQKEAYFFKVPCITLRDETEWVETLTNDCNVLAGSCERKILERARAIDQAGPWTPIYGNGHAAEAILDYLCDNCDIAERSVAAAIAV